MSRLPALADGVAVLSLRRSESKLSWCHALFLLPQNWTWPQPRGDGTKCTVT